MKSNKNILDERQEQILLRIEHNGCWLAFWGLLAAIIVQLILDVDFRNLAGEWIVFMLLSLYLSVGSIRQGIWDRRLKPDVSSIVVNSLISALALGILGFVLTVRRFPDKILGSMAAGIVYAVMAFVVCFVVMQLFACEFKRKQSKLEEEPSEGEENDKADVL